MSRFFKISYVIECYENNDDVVERFVEEEARAATNGVVERAKAWHTSVRAEPATFEDLKNRSKGWPSLDSIRERWEGVESGSIRESQLSRHAAYDISRLLGDVDALRNQVMSLKGSNRLKVRAERAERALADIQKTLEKHERWSAS